MSRKRLHCFLYFFDALNVCDTNERWLTFKNKFPGATNEHIASRTNQEKLKFHKPWVNNDMLKAIKKEAVCFDKY